MKLRRKWIIRCSAFLGGAVILAVAVFAYGLPKYRQHARLAWKTAALPEIKRLAEDPAWVADQMRMLAGTAPATGGVLAAPWLSEHMILMKNGEWLVYKSHCNKVPPRRVSDIFLARGSNGQWYYSTCHFCVGMCALILQQEDQPRDIDTFERLYHLKKFDGLSDDCLQETGMAPDFHARS
ncbi:MAG: hypothetical protein U1F77_17930 [Kiritimatiellia bacterium]